MKQNNGDVFVIPVQRKSVVENSNYAEKPKEADFETAIAATEFGKFNLFLIFVLFLSSSSSMCSTSVMSYVLPIAQCDLELTLNNKGLLNAITYVGMISSAFIWGYLADTIGRKKLLLGGYLLDGFFVILCGFSQNYATMVSLKFMSGFIINGPFAALMSYINEFHSAKYRSFVPVLNGIVHSVDSIILPWIGWVTFSDSINVYLFGGSMVLRSWNFFILLSAIPSLTAGLMYLLLPESPKFLMTTGRNDRALEIFQQVYSYNTGNPPESFPIKVLVDEVKEQQKNPYSAHVTANRTKIQALKEGWHQIIPLFLPPYVGKMILAFSIQFGLMIGLNSLRLWLPQLFTAINDYHTYREDSSAGMCEMLSMLKPQNVSQEAVCFVNYDNLPVYTNNMVVALVSLAIYLGAALFINRVGKKFVLLFFGSVAGTCGVCLYFAKSDAVVVMLSSLNIGCAGAAANVIISVVVDIFPTTLRTMTIALLMMCGRSGAVIGNLIFPILLDSGCLPTFLTIGLLTIGSTLLTFALPKTDLKALE